MFTCTAEDGRIHWIVCCEPMSFVVLTWTVVYLVYEQGETKMHGLDTSHCHRDQQAKPFRIELSTRIVAGAAQPTLDSYS
jgi:hypothetical protein